MEMSPLIWLRADYHLPATYSCRVPMSSITSARALPAPGPATVRMALIRTGIEVFGIEYMESVLFPHLRAMPIHIRPPERVALTSHVLRAYKAEEDTQVSEAPITREIAHAQGLISIYIKLPLHMQEAFSHLLQMISYWGQASSLAWCTEVERDTPSLQECVLPLHLFSSQIPLGSFFSSILSEFRDGSVTWKEVMPVLGGRSANPLRMDVYVWPLLLTGQHGGGRLFVRTPFLELSNDMYKVFS
jgi:hypothetical protein